MFLNFVPVKGCLIHLFIARINGPYEQCLDGGKHKLDKNRGLSCTVGGVDGCEILLLPVMDNRLYREPGKG